MFATSSYLASLGLYLGSNETKLDNEYLGTALITGKQEGNSSSYHVIHNT